MEFVVLENLADSVVPVAMASLRWDGNACASGDPGCIAVGCENIKHDKSWNFEKRAHKLL